MDIDSISSKSHYRSFLKYLQQKCKGYARKSFNENWKLYVCSAKREEKTYCFEFLFRHVVGQLLNPHVLKIFDEFTNVVQTNRWHYIFILWIVRLIKQSNTLGSSRPQQTSPPFLFYKNCQFGISSWKINCNSLR